MNGWFFIGVGVGVVLYGMYQDWDMYKTLVANYKHYKEVTSKPRY